METKSFFFLPPPIIMQCVTFQVLIAVTMGSTASIFIVEEKPNE
jgi:hypothetical protein